jgi:hypothetical protein
VSAPQVDYTLIEIEIGVGIKLVKLAPENRLVIMTLLQAIAEQDPRFVITNLVGEQKVKFCARTAAEAREFCASPEFTRLCALVRFNPERRHYPERAARALDDLRSQRSMQRWHARIGHDVPALNNNNKEEQYDELLFQTVSCSEEVCNW